MAERAYRNREAIRSYCRSFRLWLGVLAIGGSAVTAPGVQAQSLPDAPSALLDAQTASPPAAPARSDGLAQAAQASGAQSSSPAGSPNAAPATPSTATQPTSPPVQPAPPTTTQISTQKSAQANAANHAASVSLPRCPRPGLSGTILFLPGKDYGPCQEQNPLQFIVDSGPVRPLTPRQKGILAIRGVTDPFNFITIAAFSGITIAIDSHTAYGPGVKGFARLSGYSLGGSVQGEFIGTFAIPVLTHEDPRYHRMPGRPFRRRLAHAIVHTFVTQHDNGSLMPNYSVLLGYPIGNELANLYVPGLQTNGPATAQRIGIGIATDPVGAIIAEFLPDVAKRIHIHVIFMQQILNQVANGGAGTPP